MSAVYPLSSCIEWQFADAGALDARLRAAKAAGFELAEFHLWRDKPVAALAQALTETGMRLTSLCVDPRRSIVDPAQRDEMDLINRHYQESNRNLFMCNSNSDFSFGASGHFAGAVLAHAADMGADHFAISPSLHCGIVAL